MSRIIAIAIKDIRILSRDFGGMFFVLIFPLIMALLFGAIFGGSGSGRSKGMKIAIPIEQTSAEKAFYDQLSKADVLQISSMPTDSARALVSAGKMVAFVKYTDTSDASLSFFGGTRPAIDVWIDPTRKAEAGYLNGLINQAYFTVVQSRMMDVTNMRASLKTQIATIDTSSLLTPDERSRTKSMLTEFNEFLGSIQATDSAFDAGNDTTSVAGSEGNTDSEDYSPFRPPTVNFEEATVTSKGPRTSWEITFPQSVQWGLVGVAAAFAVSLVIERTRGTYLRLRLAPISRAHILAGKGLACFLASVTVCTVLMMIGIFVFGVRVEWPLGLVMAILSAGICFTGIMMLISVIGKTEQSVGGAGWAIFLIMAMTGGGMVPLLMMPNWMLAIGAFSPIRWSITALEGAIWRGFTPAQMATPLGILVGTGLVCFTVGVFILARRES